MTEWQPIGTAPLEINRTIMVAYKAGPHWIQRLAFWHPENGWTDVMAGTIYRNVVWWRPLPPDPDGEKQR